MLGLQLNHVNKRGPRSSINDLCLTTSAVMGLNHKIKTDGLTNQPLHHFVILHAKWCLSRLLIYKAICTNDTSCREVLLKHIPISQSITKSTMMAMAEPKKLDCRITKETTYLTFTGELWGFCDLCVCVCVWGGGGGGGGSINCVIMTSHCMWIDDVIGFNT